MGEDPDADGEDSQDQRIALKRSSLAIMFVELSDEIERIRDELNKIEE